MNRTIVLPVPENYEMDEITVVYRRRPAGSKAIRTLPPEEAQKLLGKRTYRKSGRVKNDGEFICPFCERKFETSNGMFTHQQWCEENPNRSVKRRGENVGAADPSAARKFINDLLRCPYCGKKCKNERGLGVHKASCDQNPDRKNTAEGLPETREWSDDDDLYLAEHHKDRILPLLEHFNRPEKEITDRIAHLKQTGLIRYELPPLPSEKPVGFLEKGMMTISDRVKTQLGNFLGKPEDTTPIEIGQKVWDFKYHGGEVTRLEEARQCGIVFFPSISEERKFNYDGIRRMLKAWKEKQDPKERAAMGVANE